MEKEMYDNPLSDMFLTKQCLTELFCNTEDITRLVPHCFDTPYIEGAAIDSDCAIFVDTSIIKVSQRMKQVGIHIFVVCPKESIKLNEEDADYYQSMGIYGNRVDSAIQAISSVLHNPEIMEEMKKKYFIGDLTLTENEPVKDFSPDSQFYGKCMSYTYQSFYQRKKL